MTLPFYHKLAIKYTEQRSERMKRVMAVQPNGPSGWYPQAQPEQKRQITPAQMRSAIQKARQTATQAVSQYISTETKERWANEREQLWLHKCVKTTGKFGPVWKLLLSAASPEANKGLLSMPANDYRDSYFETLGKMALVAGPVGPLMFETYETEKGNPGYDLVEWEAVNAETGELADFGDLADPGPEDDLPF